MEMIDHQAREQIAGVRDRVQKIEADYIGIDGDGKRFKINELEEALDALKNSFAQYKAEERKKTCYGEQALEEYKEDQKHKQEEEVEVKVANINAKSATTIQVIIAVGVIINTVMSSFVGAAVMKLLGGH